MKEVYSNKSTEMNMSAINVAEAEVMNKAFSGKFQDIITHADGRVEVLPWNHNVIVNSIGNLIACLLKLQSGYTGIGYWAIGSGADNWDNTNPPSAVVTDVKCTNEIGRLPIIASNITFVDGSNNDTASVTNRIRVTLTFGVNDCNGNWREFVIYGGNATATKDSGIAINHKTHGLITKTNTMTIQRQIIFTFN